MRAFWARVAIERVPMLVGTSLLFLVVSHPAWQGRAILVMWTVGLLIALVEHRQVRAHLEFHRQEVEEAKKQQQAMVEQAMKQSEAFSRAHREQAASLREEAISDLAALPRAEWMRLAVFLPPDTQMAVTLLRAERAEAERDKADPPWTPKAGHLPPAPGQVRRSAGCPRVHTAPAVKPEPREPGA